ncbi:tRNA (guanosine(37)-N1)-methyltransferase TrmD [candidate division WWE3 bacterium CG08_land_8_20_14_0_20_40_13]|uniref:tRNA (guanine-N(1)-)-methyltransferase n=1 Tax=candidate division WWE3 bacterium CG08_land_8_20_14_0_20_40_13 TaxID=1975084 RepID=A0A2H0XE20_UNCKA|nr:MAG: tRNA (guanosine(37)-N1)-methyltransferase TrmD [candidate division WWE3 bacterium CG08_land_8_20_14_0_20_40_13]
MIYHIITIFPDIYHSFLNSSLIKRAVDSDRISVRIYNLRDFAKDSRKTIDAPPYGGGAGMVLMAEPICLAINSIKKGKDVPTIIFSPKGKLLDQKSVREYSALSEVVLICPRYEGFDERIITLTKATELSIGNYILMGGDTPAMVFIETTSRLIPGVVGKEESIKNESFSEDDYLEHPQFTRPQIFQGQKVPLVLVSGNHGEIEKWKRDPHHN